VNSEAGPEGAEHMECATYILVGLMLPRLDGFDKIAWTDFRQRNAVEMARSEAQDAAHGWGSGSECSV
jgi:hypothetical protein